MESNKIQRGAIALTRWVGSPSSIIAHTVFFVVSFASAYFGFFGWNEMLLVVTTIVSLEAIYLAIFIQMSVNLQSQTIQAVEKDIDEIQEDIDEMQEDVEGIAEDVDEIQVDVDELQEDVEEIEEEGTADERRKEEQKRLLENIQTDLQKLLTDLEKAKTLKTPAPVKQSLPSAIPKKEKAAKKPQKQKLSKTVAKK